MMSACTRNSDCQMIDERQIAVEWGMRKELLEWFAFALEYRVYRSGNRQSDGGVRSLGRTTETPLAPSNNPSKPTNTLTASNTESGSGASSQYYKERTGDTANSLSNVNATAS